MSSRLLTMKFMQRAAASQPSSPSQPSTPNEERPTKKQRLSNGSQVATYDAQEAAAQDILADEERKREEALERAGRERGETKWALSTMPQTNGRHSKGSAHPQIRFVELGLGEIDRFSNEDGNDEDMKEQATGRRTFGRKLPTRGDVDLQSGPGSEDSDSSSEGSEQDDNGDEDEHEPQDIDAMVSEAARKAKRERKQRKKAEQAKSLEMAKQRRSKEVNLNSPRSISSGGMNRGGGPQAIKCHKCGAVGHKIADCQQRSGKRGRNE